MDWAGGGSRIFMSCFWHVKLAFILSGTNVFEKWFFACNSERFVPLKLRAAPITTTHNAVQGQGYLLNFESPSIKQKIKFSIESKSTSVDMTMYVALNPNDVLVAWVKISLGPIWCPRLWISSTVVIVNVPYFLEIDAGQFSGACILDAGASIRGNTVFIVRIWSHSATASVVTIMKCAVPWPCPRDFYGIDNKHK